VHLEANVLPAVNIRHWVCTLPWGIRALLGYDKRAPRDKAPLRHAAVDRSVIGMNNKQEVEVQTRGLNRGNPTPKRQGLCCGAPRLSRGEANAARPAKGGPVEVIGAWPFRMKMKRRKACLVDEPAPRGEVRSLLETRCVLATGRSRSLLFLPNEICRVPRKR
jgi:hypothetical protein